MAEATSALADAYRAEQLQARAQTLGHLWSAWQLLNPADVGGSFDVALPGMVQAVEGGAATAAEVAGRYLSDYIDVSTGTRVDPQAVRYLGDRPMVGALLTVAGRITALQQIKLGATAERALEIAFGRTARAAGSRVIDVGRTALDAAMDAEPLVIGYQRVTAAHPCIFCAGLAARGPVYRERSVQFSAHPRCGCTAEPVIRGQRLPARRSTTPDIGGHRGAEIDAFWHDHNQRYAEKRDTAIQQRIAVGQRVRGRNTDGSRKRARPEPAERTPTIPRDPALAERTPALRPEPEPIVLDTPAAAVVEAPVTGTAALDAAPIGTRRDNAFLVLSAEERSALFQYKGQAYGQLNGGLRRFEGEIPEELGFLHDMTRDLDGVMARSALTSPVEVHRAIRDGEAVFGEAAWAGDLTGAQWTEHAYTSTTADPGVVDRFHAANAPAPATFVMRVPAGTGAVELSGAEYESELLLQRGLRMRIAADTGPGAARLITLEVIP